MQEWLQQEGRNEHPENKAKTGQKEDEAERGQRLRTLW